MAQYDEFIFPKKFNETDYNQSVDYNRYPNDNGAWQRRIETERMRRELERAREDERRTAEERRNDTMEQLRRRIAEMDGTAQGYSGSAFGTRNKKEVIIERLAIKYCFFLSRMVMIASGKVRYSKSLSEKLLKSMDYFSEDSYRNKLYKAIINEGSTYGIRQEEIDSVIMHINAELGGKAIYELFINQFIGAFAIKSFKKNPSIIKDTGTVKKRTMSEDSVYRDRIGERMGALDINEIMRHLREIQDRIIGERDQPQIQTLPAQPPANIDWLYRPDDLINYDNYASGPVYEQGIGDKFQSYSLKNYIQRLFNT
jgi:hypothetical protein